MVVTLTHNVSLVIYGDLHFSLEKNILQIVLYKRLKNGIERLLAEVWKLRQTGYNKGRRRQHLGKEGVKAFQNMKPGS